MAPEADNQTYLNTYCDGHDVRVSHRVRQKYQILGLQILCGNKIFLEITFIKEDHLGKDLRSVCFGIREIVHIECVLGPRVAPTNAVSAVITSWLRYTNVVLLFVLEVHENRGPSEIKVCFTFSFQTTDNLDV